MVRMLCPYEIAVGPLDLRQGSPWLQLQDSIAVSEFVGHGEIPIWRSAPRLSAPHNDLLEAEPDLNSG